MSDQSLRDALESVAGLMASGKVTYLDEEYVRDILASHAAEPAPVVTDEAVEAAVDSLLDDGHNGLECDRPARPLTPQVRAALEAAAPLLGPRPLLDEIAVRNKIAEWYGAEWIAKDSTFYETDDTRTLDDPDEGAMHAYRGFRWAQELARPMPTRDDLHDAIYKALPGEITWHEASAAAVAVLALLNGAES